MGTERVSKIGNYAIASSSLGDSSCITCTTFNVLAPIYKSLSKEGKMCKESDFKASWLMRNHLILDWLLYERSSIICLQEVWVGNEELVTLYEGRLRSYGYKTFKLARTNNRGDGLMTALHKDYFSVVNERELLFNDGADRVAQLFHVELVLPGRQEQILIVNTHLLFPHDASLSLVRLHQVYRILQHVESYQNECCKLHPIPIILCGDWNGSKRGYVYKFLRSHGFVSSYDVAHKYTDADAHKWVSHRNHRGNICGVDFIWLLNPPRTWCCKILKTSWTQTVSGMFRCLLQRASLTEHDAFTFLKPDDDDDFITYSGFCEALRQFNLTGHCYGLTGEETREMWLQIDAHGSGVVDFQMFQQRIWRSEQEHKEETEITSTTTTGLTVVSAVLFPCQVEKGKWPDNYSLSDHARLTVVFSPVRMPVIIKSLS